MASPLNEREIFLLAIEIEDPVARNRLVARCCTSRPGMLDAVSRLLREHDAQTRCIIDRPLFDTDPAIELTNTGRKPGDEIGPFRLLNLLGTGGMGEVWNARQLHPVEREVALKLIRPGRESPGAVGRFRRELRALSAMEHPNIARVLDAGLTSVNQPFFVMERVDGDQLTAFCNKERLSIRQRLEIFLQVVKGVGHAHQKAILHRDLKPSNVLVTRVDGQPVAKIIDFGLAKALVDGSEPEHVTRYGQFVGTLAYMPPEQAGFEQENVDTRSDIYSLGAMLYEVIAGKHPFEGPEWEAASLSSRIKMLHESQPPRPSARTAGDSIEKDLNWIVMRAIAKEPDRRYQTADDLYRDVRRFLDGAPVEAHPPTARYRFRKFVSRHRGLVASLTTVAATLILGLCGTTYGLWQAGINEKLLIIEAANANQAQAAAETAADSERRQRIYAEAIAAFVQNDILRLTSVEGQLETGAWATLGRDASLYDLLVRAGGKIDDREYLDPRIEPALHMIIGHAYSDIGKFEDAAHAFEKSLEHCEAVYGHESVEVGNALYQLASVDRRRGRLDAALAGFEKANELKVRFLGETHPDTLADQVGRALVFCSRKDYDHAAELLEETALTSGSVLGAGHSTTLRTRFVLADVYSLRGEFEEAIEIYKEVLARYMNEDDFQAVQALRAMNHLGLAYRGCGQIDLAIGILEDALEKVEFLLEKDHLTAFSVRNNLGCCYYTQRRLDISIPHFEDLVDRMSAYHSPGFPALLEVQTNLAANYRADDRVVEALSVLEQIQPLCEGLPSIHLWVLTEMSDCHLENGNDRRYEQTMRKRIALLEELYGADSTKVFRSRNALARRLCEAGNYEAASVEFRLNLEVADGDHWSGSVWSKYYTESQLGGVLMQQGRDQEARVLLESGFEGMRQFADDLLETEGSIRTTERNSIVSALERLLQMAEKMEDEDAIHKWTEELGRLEE